MFGASCHIREDVVGQERDEDAQHDRQLLHRSQSTTNARRCDLCDIGGGDH